MLSSFLRHHLDRARNGLIRNVVANCHVHGVNSVVLSEDVLSDGKIANRIRIFHATKDHNLTVNHPYLNGKLSLAIHPHHCSIQLVRIFGKCSNHIYVHSPIADAPLVACIYSSKLLTGKAGLEPTNRPASLAYSHRESGLLTQRGTCMEAATLHTVSVPRGESAAWLVFEGKEDPNYEPICYTNNPEASFEGLYDTSNPELAEQVLQECLMGVYWMDA